MPKIKYRRRPRGVRRNPQRNIDLVIQGKGQYKTWKPPAGGHFGLHDADFGSFDMEQAKANRAAGLC